LSGAFWESGQVKRRIVQGIRPRDSASGLGNSPSLRRRDMDIKLIFNYLRQTVDWRKKIDNLGRTWKKMEDKNSCMSHKINILAQPFVTPDK